VVSVLAAAVVSVAAAVVSVAAAVVSVPSAAVVVVSSESDEHAAATRARTKIRTSTFHERFKGASFPW
jgi:hypothetical protein